MSTANMTTAKKIIEAVCKESSLRESQLLSPSRIFPLVAARMLVILLLERRGYTDERIGWILNRARVTITSLRSKSHDELDTNPSFRHRYETLKQTTDNG